MNNDRAAWKRMEEYNKNDVILLEKIYDKFKGWISNHPNHNSFSNSTVCPNCNYTRLTKQGSFITSSRKYQRYQCKDCGKWSKSVKSEKVTHDLVTSI
jgi:DNA-directed RNA polymerase subunit RPC12/RpoP